MPLFHIVILAFIQGITEFLPISSSGHLALVHHVLHHTNGQQDLIFDIAVHVGTLFAVLVYFRQDIFCLIKGALHLCSIQKSENDADKKIFLLVFVGSLPVIVAGYIMYSLQPSFLRSLEIMAWCTIIYALVLWIIDHFKPTSRKLDSLTIKEALFIGFAQILSLIPGTSRSGITMTAARFLGFSRTESARFSLLLATIAISGAGVLGGLDLLNKTDLNFTSDILLSVLFSFGAGWVSISLMMKWLERASFLPFILYRLILGSLLLFLIYSGVLSV